MSKKKSFLVSSLKSALCPYLSTLSLKCRGKVIIGWMGESTPHIFCCHQSRSVLLQCILPFTKVPNSGLHVPEDKTDSTLSCISPFSSGFDLLRNLTVARERPHCSPLTPKVSTSLPKSCQKANTKKGRKGHLWEVLTYVTPVRELSGYLHLVYATHDSSNVFIAL